ncbi:MAG: non-canonical purine NTP pyrophosphatase [SAR324 cluster bacterium]|nr:non-canonical purine NTP pyrophosphatase [SAR324 cluster bacterium]
MTLRFVTTNRDKLTEASELLRRPLIAVNLALDELQTTDLEKIVRHKAQQAYRKVRSPLIVEDTALIFKEWHALPGPFIKHFIEHLGLAGMVDALAPFDNWDAEARCGIGYHDGERVHYFEGRVAGAIASPAGKGGFGWDPIFRPEGASQTFAEMTREEKHGYSMRAVAMKALAAHLDSPRAAFMRTFSPQEPAPPEPGRSGPG